MRTQYKTNELSMVLKIIHNVINIKANEQRDFETRCMYVDSQNVLMTFAVIILLYSYIFLCHYLFLIDSKSHIHPPTQSRTHRTSHFLNKNHVHFNSHVSKQPPIALYIYYRLATSHYAKLVLYFIQISISYYFCL